MKNAEVLGKLEDLTMLEMAGLAGVKLSYALTCNAKLIGEEANKIKGALKYPKAYEELREKYRKLFQEHAKKDQKGNLIVQDNKYVLDPEKKDAYDKLVAEEEKASKAIIEEAQAVEEEYKNFLQEEATLSGKIVTIKLEHLPETITPAQMAALSFMIEELQN